MTRLDGTWGAALARDFQCTLLWLRSMEVARGESLALTLSELDMPNLFHERYRPPFKA